MIHLRERPATEVLTFVRGESDDALTAKVAQADFIFHLAGINRPKHDEEFVEGNSNLTVALCKAIQQSGRAIPVLFTSSTQADRDNAYGTSKRNAEEALRRLATQPGQRVYIYRLPNVFGKWCRPNYNSAVATFCNNISQNLPIQINDPTAILRLVYIDDVVDAFLSKLNDRTSNDVHYEVAPVYETTVGQVAELIYLFKESRSTMITPPVGVGLARALYSTYLSYFTPEQFSYALVKHEDQRGVFVEMLKTRDAGQFSFFTARPGVTRGGHYHHTKTEKFLVIKGSARFGFRHIDTGETYSCETSAATPQIVETIPGWSHDITNTGNDEMIVMLWANEIFDRQKPDTVAYKV